MLTQWPAVHLCLCCASAFVLPVADDVVDELLAGVEELVSYGAAGTHSEAKHGRSVVS